jgi:hypothetical protein
MAWASGQKLQGGNYTIEQEFGAGGFGIIPLLSLSGRAISRSFISQSIQAILLQKLGCCICY